MRQEAPTQDCSTPLRKRVEAALVIQGIGPNELRRTSADSVLQQELRFGLQAYAVLGLIVPRPIEATKVEINEHVERLAPATQPRSGRARWRRIGRRSCRVVKAVRPGACPWGQGWAEFTGEVAAGGPLGGRVGRAGWTGGLDGLSGAGPCGWRVGDGWLRLGSVNRPP